MQDVEWSVSCIIASWITRGCDSGVKVTHHQYSLPLSYSLLSSTNYCILFKLWTFTLK